MSQRAEKCIALIKRQIVINSSEEFSMECSLDASLVITVGGKFDVRTNILTRNIDNINDYDSFKLWKDSGENI